MKSFIFASLVLSGVALADADTDYVNFIRQVQQDTGVEWDITVLPQGNGLVSPTGVSVDGAFFELWSIHNVSTSEFLLDEQFVTSYTPNATVDIITADPYQAVRRTRCDQPFQVRVTVTGLLDPADPNYASAPDAAKMVDYIHSAFAYPDGTHSLDGVSNPAGTLVDEGTMEDNTTATVTFDVTNLPDTDLTLVEGEEVFTVSALADFGVSASILDSDRVQIWPLAQASISGYDPTDSYEIVPPVTVTLLDLYPASATYLRIYEGPPSENPTAPSIATSSYVIIEDSIPQDRTLALRDLDRYFVKGGVHTLEIVHHTPFGAEVLHTASITVDRTVEVKASLYADK